MQETIAQNAMAVNEVIKNIVQKYNLPEEEVFQLASSVYAENMQYKPKE